MHHQATIISIMYQEFITSEKDTSFLHGNAYKRKPQIFFFFIFNSLHRFEGYNMFEAITPP